MKARVKATGGIIELSDLEYDVYGNDYLRNELKITDKPDYWEKLKHQYAGMAMQRLLSNSAYLENYVKYSVVGESFTTVVTENAVDYATALVNRLKEESQCEK